MQKRLTKSQNKIIAGVYGGIANYFNLDQALVRLIAAAVTIFTGFFPGIIFYVVAMIVMPESTRKDNTMDGNFTKK